jgi:hypothetical protein
MPFKITGSPIRKPEGELMPLPKEKRRKKHSPRDWWMQFSKRFPIFPVKEDKTPAVRSWKTEASKDPEVIDMWLNKFGEDVAFAMPTGDASGVWAIDIKKVLSSSRLNYQTIQIP